MLRLLINVIFVVVLGVGGGFSLINIIQGNGAGLAHWVVWGFVAFLIWFFLSIATVSSPR